MARIKCILSYDGSGFSGYQKQPGARTVQGEIEAVLKKMHKQQDVKITASGRTDAGVHALGQVFHFDSPLQIDPDSWKRALNSQLPEEIVIRKVMEVTPSFHARFDVIKKEYRYRVLRAGDRDVFRRKYTYHFPQPLDLPAIKEAAGHFVGTYDYTAYCSAKTDVEDKVRTIHALEVKEDGDELVFHFVGNGFLYNMVRLITGDLLRVGIGKITSADIDRMLETGERRLSGLNIPGSGLYLWKVFYDNES